MPAITSQLSGGYDSTHIYYNISITNNNVNTNTEPPNVIFNETRNSPYLNNPNDYYMSVVRFSLETPTLPIWIPQVKVGQTDISATVYSITLSYDLSGVTYNQQSFLSYIPQDKSQTLPRPPVTFQDVTSEYYYVYSYTRVIELFNNTFASAFAGLKATVNALPGSPQLPSNIAPFFEWDPVGYTAILNADISGYNLNSTPPSQPIKIFFNQHTFNLFSSFNADYLGYQASFGKNFQIIVKNLPGGNTFTYPNFTALQMFQEYPTSPLWNPVQAMVFTTALLPVVPELTALPVVFGADSKYVSSGNNSNITPVLTDFEVPLVTGSEYKPQVTYSPTAEYRLTDLYGNQPLSALEIRVFWRDIFGNLKPFKLFEGCNASIKLMFRKKNFNSNY